MRKLLVVRAFLDLGIVSECQLWFRAQLAYHSNCTTTSWLTLGKTRLLIALLFSHLENGAISPVEVRGRPTRRCRSPATLTDHHQETWVNPSEQFGVYLHTRQGPTPFNQSREAAV